MALLACYSLWCIQMRCASICHIFFFIFVVHVSTDGIMQKVIKSIEGHTMNSDRVRAALAQLVCDLPSVTGVDATYSIVVIVHSILSKL